MAAVVLAAGAGSRFRAAGGTHKLLAPWRGTTVAGAAVGAAVAAGIGPVWVVTGAADLAGVLPPGVEALPNGRWADGQATSLAAAVERARAEGLDALVVGLADQPLVTPEAWRAVAAGAGVIAVATYGGRRGNPVKLGRRCWDLLPAAGDTGARAVMARRPDLVEEVACDGSAADIDTVEDLDRWS